MLFVLHQSPPTHGAARVGDIIGNSLRIKGAFETRFVKIKSSEKISDIGNISVKKCLLVVNLYFRVMWGLIKLRPSKVYYTSSIQGVALYRDLLVSTLFKAYAFFSGAQIYYHYHTKGVNEYVATSRLRLALTRFYIRGVNLILLSPLLEHDFNNVTEDNRVFFLPNGILDPIAGMNLGAKFIAKYDSPKVLQILYLSHMIKSKGYDEVLYLALKTRDLNVHFHFAGGWASEEEFTFFNNFVNHHDLHDRVSYHGFVSGQEKRDLYGLCHILLYPTKNDAFPLTILESLAFGVPVIAMSEGSIPLMIDDKSGIVVGTSAQLAEDFSRGQLTLVNLRTALHCRERFLKNFSLEIFEDNLVRILNE